MILEWGLSGNNIYIFGIEIRFVYISLLSDPANSCAIESTCLSTLTYEILILHFIFLSIHYERMRHEFGTRYSFILFLERSVVNIQPYS